MYVVSMDACEMLHQCVMYVMIYVGNLVNYLQSLNRMVQLEIYTMIYFILYLSSRSTGPILHLIQLHCMRDAVICRGQLAVSRRGPKKYHSAIPLNTTMALLEI